ncbi:MAG: FG-GAP-like repeat-containing protein, partial [bacterium]
MTRTGDLSYDAYLSFQTSDGTAVSGQDYTGITGTLKIPAGVSSTSLPVSIWGSNVSVPDKSFTLQIPGASSTPPVPSFAPLQTFATGTFAYSVTVADVNGDGKPDLITADANSSDVSVLINTTAPGATTPSFAPRQSLATGASPWAVTAADVNGDGKVDLIVAVRDNAQVSVFLNTTPAGSSTASFAAPQNFAIAGQQPPFDVTTADLNDDGLPDVVVTLENGGIDIFLNGTTPNGTVAAFQAPQVFGTNGSFSVSTAAADLNGDGKPDLVVTNKSDATLWVLLNTTAPGATVASFDPIQTFPAGSFTFGVAAADLNGDGVPDVVYTDRAAGTVTVMLNGTASGSHTASFIGQQTFTVGGLPYSVVVTDINGDGVPDLVVANSSNSTISVLLNTTLPGASTPSFAAQQTFADDGSYSIKAADLNADGRPDLVVAGGDNNVA